MTTYAPRLLLAAALLFTLTGWTAAQTTINPTADAYVQGGNNAAKNFGTAKRLKAQTNATANKNFDSYLKFDMSTVPTFSAVKLRLYAALSDNGSVGTTLYAVSNTSWGETTITWNNKPALGAALASGSVVNKTFAWYEFDVTSYLAAEHAAGRNVVTLALRASTASSRTVKVKSREASTNKPQLVLTPAPPNVPPSVSLTAPANNASFAAPATIPLSANATDSDGTVTKVEFFHGGTNLIATVTQLPYTFDWTNVAAGSYALTAQATDNLGAITTSSPVNVTVTVQPALYFIHPDHLNTPRVITNQAQQVVWRWDNDDPFGGNMASENPSGLGNFTCNLRFPGQYFDTEANLHYNYFRDYSPEIGRYVQSDPIALRGGLNTYAHVYDNPISFADPQGLEINWGNYIITNPWVVSNFVQLNQDIVNSGVPDKCFMLQVTGGDRFRQSRRVHRSLTDNSIVPDSAAKSPHLIEQGARGIDFKIILSSAPECSCSGVTSGVVRNALPGTDFSPREMKDEQDYQGRPHIHLNLPNDRNKTFWNIEQP